MNEETKKALRIVLGFVERWNKKDGDKDVAQAAQDLELILSDGLLGKAIGYDKSKLEKL